MIGGPWFVAGQIIGVEQWAVGSMSNASRKFTSPVWIRLPNLSLAYWDADNLARIATGIGEPLFMDEPTNSWNRCAFARICVRLDLSKKLPKGVWAHGLGGSFFQPIEYEGIPLICLACGKVGHKAEACRDSSTKARVHRPSPATAGPAPPEHRNDMEVDRIGAEGLSMKKNLADASPLLENDEQGEWTIVIRRRRPKPARNGANLLDQRNVQPGTARRTSTNVAWKVVNKGDIPKGSDGGSATGIVDTNMIPRNACCLHQSHIVTDVGQVPVEAVSGSSDPVIDDGMMDNSCDKPLTMLETSVVPPNNGVACPKFLQPDGT
ncbi:hypothetical protein KFK09_026308 [Dendrobium nobile]|uniref:CCHC-type domain-containing protein n=1 Tax=Dendrobium nobile TaxID=94219 RepID=A0A8T3A7G2_DENNO|nr:hypothetical protein KFK09_026308 [Dendrobium nobile]